MKQTSTGAELSLIVNEAIGLTKTSAKRPVSVTFIVTDSILVTRLDVLSISSGKNGPQDKAVAALDDNIPPLAVVVLHLTIGVVLVVSPSLYLTTISVATAPDWGATSTGIICTPSPDAYLGRENPVLDKICSSVVD